MEFSTDSEPALATAPISVTLFAHPSALRHRDRAVRAVGDPFGGRERSVLAARARDRQRLRAFARADRQQAHGDRAGFAGLVHRDRVGARHRDARFAFARRGRVVGPVGGREPAAARRVRPGVRASRVRHEHPGRADAGVCRNSRRSARCCLPATAPRWCRNRLCRLAPLPVSLEPCCVHVDPERVNTHVAPAPPLSNQPPISAVFPSPDSATLLPK